MKVGYLLLSGLLLMGCSEQSTHTVQSEKPVVYTVNYPLAYFAKRIAGDRVEVVFPEMEGDPAFWEPTPDQIAQFQQADLILLNGADYAKWIPKSSLPQSRMVNTAQGLEDQFIALDGSVTHTHGPGGAHAHGDLAFTLWLDPEIAAKQASAVFDAISSKTEMDDSGLKSLLSDLQQLDAEQKKAFEAVGDRPLLGSHPVYQYLSRRYDLNMESVHWEPDSEPDQAMWRELEDILETHKADIMLWEDGPLPQVKKALEEKGIKSIVFNPCGNRPGQGDYLSVQQGNIKNLKEVGRRNF
jgi:zinc transport system substrate-binding protein